MGLRAWQNGWRYFDGLDHRASQAIGIRRETKSYVDSVVQDYGQNSGLRLSQGELAGAAGGSAGGAMMNSEELEKFQQGQDAFVSHQLAILEDGISGRLWIALKHIDQ